MKSWEDFTDWFVYMLFCFQHSFVSSVTDLKPVRDLVLEAKADVEVIETEADDITIKVIEFDY